MTTEKTCPKCKILKKASEYQKHSKTSDGLQHACRKCRAIEKKEYRAKNLKRIASESSEYYQRTKAERLRYGKEYRKENKEKVRETVRQTRAKYPKKYRARGVVSSAINRGKLERLPCEVCGSTKLVEGHHDDYNKPLEVRWLCIRHHRDIHNKARLDAFGRKTQECQQ